MASFGIIWHPHGCTGHAFCRVRMVLMIANPVRRSTIRRSTIRRSTISRSTTKRVYICLVPSWILDTIWLPKMKSCLGCCGQRSCVASFSGFSLFQLHTPAQACCWTYCVPLQMNPKKFEKHAFCVETLRRKISQIWLQNQSIKIQIVPLDRSYCP